MPDRDAMIEAAADALIAQGHYYGSWEDQRNAAVPNAAAVLDVVRPLILRSSAEMLRGAAAGEAGMAHDSAPNLSGLLFAAELLERLADGDTTTANDSAGAEST